jgi:hypothetical protein
MKYSLADQALTIWSAASQGRQLAREGNALAAAIRRDGLRNVCRIEGLTPSLHSIAVNAACDIQVMLNDLLRQEDDQLSAIS